VRITLVAAVARGGVIGREGTIPWRLPEDLERFKELTTGHAVVMGRRTWDSIPERFRPLPGRRNVVVTRNPEWSARGAERAGSLEDALHLLEGESRAYVIGGAEIYAAALPLADELELTEIDLDVEGDTHFPPVDPAEFREAARESHASADGTSFSFVRYVRWTGADARGTDLGEPATSA
jgi:dihydrofolate reductase